MKYVFTDFETHYSKEYSLRHMDPPSYILDERFEAICLGVAEGFDDPPYLVDGPDIPRVLNDLGTDVAMGSHNALFDMSILAWRYDYVPRLMIDTLSMSRTLLGHKVKRHGLAVVAKYFGHEKGDEIVNAQGMCRADLLANPEFWERYKRYCLNDTDLCRMIYMRLAPELPPEEFILHDMILRCAVEPQFRTDAGLLQQYLADVGKEKQRLFTRAMFAGIQDRSDLMSNDRLAEVLQSLGVEPPRKVSTTTQRLTWAFSKQDPQFLALLEHDEPRVVAIVEARLSEKSNIEKTRATRMLNIAGLTFPGKGSGLMPIPLNIGAAHTHRLGGGWKLNPQNWGRKSPIRRAMLAPEGYKVVTADSSQIEARMTAWFCGQWDLVEQFRRGEDVYSNFAQDIFHVPVSKATEPTKRFIGKTGVLQLGYQASSNKFQSSVWLLSYATEPEPIVLSGAESDAVVRTFRDRFDAITRMWDRLRDLIRFMAQSRGSIERSQVLGPVTFSREKVEGPNGLCIRYDNLMYEGSGWVYQRGGAIYKLYGGKLLENIVQFLARIAVMQAALRLRKPLSLLNVRLTHTSHDEIIYIVRDDYVGHVTEMIRQEMSLTPVWAPGLPLACEIGVGQSYGDAK